MQGTAASIQDRQGRQGHERSLKRMFTAPLRAAVLTYWALNEVARDLEDCFLYDPNDAPLARLQAR